MRINGTHTADELMPLYRRLPRGPHRMTREEVARNQRARLYGAMIESVSQRGYQATTVEHVVTLAGVSRRSFYEHFASKEACFLATHQSILARQRRRVIDAWMRSGGWANRLHTACATLLGDIAEHPKGPRLVLVDSLEIGVGAQARMQLTGATFECLVATVLQMAAAGPELAGVSSRAIVGGIRQVVFVRMLDGRERELATLSGEVLDWIDNYRVSASARLATLEPRAHRQPPDGASLLAGRDQRGRALAAVVRLTLAEGYAQLSDSRIAERAGISTVDFHRHFSDKQECLLAVLDEFMRESLHRVREALETARSWPEAVDRAMQSLVAYLLAHRELLRLTFVELFALGPQIVGRLTGSIEQLTGLLTSDAPPPRRAPSLAREAMTGAVWAVIAGHLAGGHRSRPLCPVDQLTYAVLAPYLGATAAVDEIAAARRAPHAL